MECSNCGEVLESGCSVSAGLRQEDRLILDWERGHKGRSCSGAPRPFGKLKWEKKEIKRELFIHTSLVLQDVPLQMKTSLGAINPAIRKQEPHSRC